MPAFQSVPTYKIVRVAARIGIVIYCRTGNRNCGKNIEDLLPTALGAASAALIGVPTYDIGGLIVVGIKVALRLVKIYGGRSIPLSAESQNIFVVDHSFPHRDGTWIEGHMEQEVSLDMNFVGADLNDLAKSAIDEIMDWELGKEIISIILEEFPVHKLGTSLVGAIIPGFDLSDFDLEDFELEDFDLDQIFGESGDGEEIGDTLWKLFTDDDDDD